MSTVNNRKPVLGATLAHLEDQQTLSPFCRLFYRLLYDITVRMTPPAPKLEQAFHTFLRCECRRHEFAGRLAHEGNMDVLEILSLGRRTQSRMNILKRALLALETTERSHGMLRELLLAECAYHLGQTKEVVERLGNAIRLGCRHSLAHFALGYNIYSHAMQRFTRAGPKRGEVVATDPEALQRSCREAIDAFQGGLGDSLYDAQIHWWIGLIWEMLGERQAAGDAYRSAMASDPEHFVEQGSQKLRLLGMKAPYVRTALEAQRLGRLAPITEEEMHRLRDTLAKVRTLPELFK